MTATPKSGRIKLVLAAALLLAAAPACHDEYEPPAPPPEAREPTSPANVLANVALAFNYRNEALLRESLTNDFTFYFAAADVGLELGGYFIPASWSYAETVAAAAAMFAHAYSIQTFIDTDGVGEPAPSDTRYDAPGVKTTLTVMFDAETGLAAERGYCNYAFASYLAGGRKLWRLSEWRDFSGGGLDGPAGVESTSVGFILANFHG